MRVCKEIKYLALPLKQHDARGTFYKGLYILLYLKIAGVMCFIKTYNPVYFLA